MRRVFVLALFGLVAAEEAAEAAEAVAVETEEASSLSPEEQAVELLSKFDELKTLLADREKKGLPKDEALDGAVKKLEALLGTGGDEEAASPFQQPTILDPVLMKRLGIVLIAVLFGSILLLVWFITRPKVPVETRKKK